jgi:exodeoxyribonuclease X
MHQALIIDTETTGIKEPIEVIELAFKSVGRNEALSVKRFKPSRIPEWGAIATHHILMTDLEHCTPANEAEAWLPNSEYLIGHGVDYDWAALGKPPGYRICTLAMSRELWPEIDSHKLTAMMYYTQGANAATRERVRSAHSAGDDVLMCESLLEVIMEVAKIRDFESLWNFSEEARIPKTWAFGKFFGQPIGAADRGYMNWYRKLPDADPYVIKALKRNGL